MDFEASSPGDFIAAEGEEEDASSTIYEEPGGSYRSRYASWECPHCEKTFRKRYDVVQHIRSHTGERPYHCVVCGRGFSQKSNAKKHMASHKAWPNPPPSQSASGDALTCNSSSLLPIIRTDEQSGISVAVQKIFNCQFCERTFLSYKEFRRHQTTHSDEKSFKCPQTTCSELFKTLGEFLSHVRLHENEIKYTCHICSASFDTLERINLHRLAHHLRQETRVTAKKFPCSKCSISFATSEALRDHECDAQHEKVSCSLCGKQLASSKSLAHHTRLQHATDKSECVCLVCGKQLSSPGYLRSHILIHQGELPFECDVCSLRFNRKDKLKRHSLKHAEATLRCPFQETGCSKVFYRLDKLKSHVSTHGSTGPVTCDDCQEVFPNAKDLRAHRKSAHQRVKKSLKCFKCRKTFKWEKQRQTHHKQVHGLTHDATSAANGSRSEAESDQLTDIVVYVPVQREGDPKIIIVGDDFEEIPGEH